MTLERSTVPIRTVGDEIAYVRAYLDVERQRWGDRLSVAWHVAPGLDALPLPPFVLQPLVENALRHGLGAREAGGHLVIRVGRTDTHLVLGVEDDGEGFPPRYEERTGLGNLRGRLAALYGGSASMVIDGAGGARVTLSLPLQPCAS
jgi:LytS/YehU family sensor histidine kinase